MLLQESRPTVSRNPTKAWDAVGFLGSGLVITAFCMKDIVQLRIVAVASNMAFLAYGIALGLMPVWLLHLLLLPVNLGRLWQISSRMATRPTRDHAKARLRVRRTRDGRRIGTQVRRSVGDSCRPSRSRAHDAHLIRSQIWCRSGGLPFLIL